MHHKSASTIAAGARSWRAGKQSNGLRADDVRKKKNPVLGKGNFLQTIRDKRTKLSKKPEQGRGYNEPILGGIQEFLVGVAPARGFRSGRIFVERASGRFFCQSL
ncbi:MAG: hypothetical protein SPJ12_03105 [Duodenibacillus sp.]|nr:hypothetical protein [Duodenibacillus sp.]